MIKTHFGLLILAFLVLAGCSQTDTERLHGTWKPLTVTVDGKVTASLDPQERQKARAAGRDIDEQDEVLKGTSMEFKPDGTIQITMEVGGGSSAMEGHWLVDEEKKQLTVSRQGNDSPVYTYEFRGDDLVLWMKPGSETAFRKK